MTSDVRSRFCKVTFSNMDVFLILYGKMRFLFGRHWSFVSLKIVKTLPAKRLYGIYTRRLLCYYYRPLGGLFCCDKAYFAGGFTWGRRFWGHFGWSPWSQWVGSRWWGGIFFDFFLGGAAHIMGSVRLYLGDFGAIERLLGVDSNKSDDRGPQSSVLGCPFYPGFGRRPGLDIRGVASPSSRISFVFQERLTKFPGYPPGFRVG